MAIKISWHRFDGFVNNFSILEPSYEQLLAKIHEFDPQFRDNGGIMYYLDGQGDKVIIADKESLADAHLHAQSNGQRLLNIYSNHCCSSSAAEANALLPIAKNKSDILMAMLQSEVSLSGVKFLVDKFAFHSDKPLLEKNFVERFGRHGFALDLDKHLINSVKNDISGYLSNFRNWDFHCQHFDLLDGKLFSKIHVIRPWDTFVQGNEHSWPECEIHGADVEMHLENEEASLKLLSSKNAVNLCKNEKALLELASHLSLFDLLVYEHELQLHSSFCGFWQMTGLTGEWVEKITDFYLAKFAIQGNVGEGTILKMKNISAAEYQIKNFLDIFTPTLIEIEGLASLETDFNWICNSTAFRYAKILVVRRDKENSPKAVAKFHCNAIVDLLHTKWEMPEKFQPTLLPQQQDRSLRDFFERNLVDYIPSIELTCKIVASSFCKKIVTELMCLPGRVFCFDLELIKSANGIGGYSTPYPIVQLLFTEFIKANEPISYLIFIKCPTKKAMPPNVERAIVVNALGESFRMRRFRRKDETEEESKILCIERLPFDCMMLQNMMPRLTQEVQNNLFLHGAQNCHVVIKKQNYNLRME